MRVVLGEPQCRQGGPRFPAFAVWFAEFGQGLLGVFYLAETHQDMTSPGAVRRSSSCSRSANRWW